MFSIGEFSKIGRVTVDTLRHYDALGLLKPAKVDPFTGYRYYSARQLLSLNQILALKEIGFSLEALAAQGAPSPSSQIQGRWSRSCGMIGVTSTCFYSIAFSPSSIRNWVHVEDPAQRGCVGRLVF